MKVVRSERDLAVNGAKPLFDTPLHVGRPNFLGRDRFFEYMEEVFDNKWLTNDGPMVKELERRIAAFLGTRHCVLTCNGTIALEVAVRALDLTGEVIVPSYTFIATAHALWWQRIKPVFADIDPETHNLDPASVRRMVSSRTTGIIGVHLWGRPAPSHELQQLAKEHELKLLFDAAHAFGCGSDGRLIGNFGDCEIFSFHATKFFNTFEGGAVVTNDDQLHERLCLMRNFGFSGFDSVVSPGTNGKMSEASAAMGLANLEFLDEIVAINRKWHRAYRAELAAVPHVRLMQYDESERSNYQYVVIELDQRASISRDDLVGVLQAENVLARRYFWPGCHNMSPYRELFPENASRLPNTMQVANGVIVLPTGSNITAEDIAGIVAVLKVAVR